MKISRILAYRVELPLHETTYKWSGGKSVTVFDSTIVGVETDTGLIGYGLEIVETLPIEIHANPHNEAYLTTKRDKMGHEIMRPVSAETPAA